MNSQSEFYGLRTLASEHKNNLEDINYLFGCGILDEQEKDAAIKKFKSKNESTAM